MQNFVSKTSILSVEDCELVSLSYRTQIANNQYYLVEIKQKNQAKSSFTWEQISVVEKRFPSATYLQKQLLEKGRILESKKQFQISKADAYSQIKSKFWSVNQDSDHEVPRIQDEIANQEKDKFSYENTQKKYASILYQNQIEQENQLKSKLTTINLQKQHEYEHRKNQRPKHQISNKANNQYYKIKKVKPQYTRQEVNYLVENILGETKFISGCKLKKTHLLEVLVFLQDYLEIKK